MPSLVLKIDVDTYRGTREGALNLARILNKHQAGATFLYSLGPDHTGWAMKRALRPGFFSKVSRTSVVEHYGLKTLMYGVLLPGPDIGKECAAEMRAVRDAGFECGIHTWDHVVWQDYVRHKDAAWTRQQMLRSFERYTDIFGETPKTHGAAGWQMNEAAFRQLDTFGFAYASDGRCVLNEDGSLKNPATAGAYRLQDAAGTLSHVQMPTTLPTLDEILGREIHGEVIEQPQIARSILRLTETPRDHVFTLHAELEGQKLAPIFEELLAGWRAQGYTLESMAGQYQRIKDQPLASAPVTWGSLPGRSGELVIQA